MFAIIVFLSILLPLYTTEPFSIVPVDTTSLFYKHCVYARITEQSDIIFESLLKKTRTFEGSHVSTVLENIREDVKRMRTDFSWKIIARVLDVDICEIADVLGISYQEDSAQLRIALLCESMLAISRRSHACYLKNIYELELSHLYWKHQSEYPFYCTLTQNPLALLKYNQQKKQLHDKCIESSRLLHSCYEHLGMITRTIGSRYRVDQMQEWLTDALTLFPCRDLTHNALIKSSSVEELIIELKRLAFDSKQYEKNLLKELNFVLIPSHWKRNWLWYSFGVSAAFAGWYYVTHNKPFLERSTVELKQVMSRNYNTYVLGPLVDIQKELLSVEGAPPSAGEQIRKLVQELKPSNEWQGHIAQQLIDYYPKTFNALAINYDMKELVKRAGMLDENFFNILLSQVMSQWDTGGFLFESYSNPFAKTTKSKVVQYVPNLFFLKTQMAECNLKNKAAAALEVSAQRIHETEKKLNLILAIIALYPAYWVAQQIWKGIKKCGGYWIPKGYDDRPIYHFLSELKEMLDDENYLTSRRTIDFFSPSDYVIGKIVYMCSLLRCELQKVHRNGRTKMEELLRKFYEAPTNQGKLIYLQKMLDEYKSWPRLIKQ